VTLAEFLTARLNEREASARYAAGRDTGPAWHAEDCGQCGGHVLGPGTPARELVVVDCYPNEGGGLVDPVHQFIAENDPAYVLSDVAGRRRIVDLHDDLHCCLDAEGERVFPDDTTDPVQPIPCPTLRLLALPYAAHPDYRAEWSP
jgi:hypothetical protein